ncbi:hypothetical protein FRB96_004221 [Tulasnella sp. 330]|nr:hypothetical protein FRB96_004221 [Tulasnella sp. 330]
MINITAEAKLQNSALPIHRVVEEVSIEIFLYYADPTSSNISEYYARIRNIALVSTTWATLVSKGCPLMIGYDDGWGSMRTQNAEWMISFVEIAYREIHRWRTAHLKILDTRLRPSKLLLSYLSLSSTPLLSELQLDCGSLAWPDQPIDPFWLGAGRLRALSLRSVRINWESPRLEKLATLILYGRGSTASPSASQLAQILRACPGLIRFEIDYALSTVVAVPIDPSPIELPALTVFKMDLSVAIATYVLAVVRIPACKKFDLAASSPAITFLPDALQHHIPTLASRVASAPLVTIALEEAQNLFYDASENVSINLFNSVSILDGLVWIIDHLHPSTLSVPIHLRIDYPHLPASLLVMQPLTTSVTTLDVPGDCEIIRYLSQPVTVDGVRLFPLSNLRELHLTAIAGSEPQDVIHMVESRLGRTGSSLESERGRPQRCDWPELPAKLRKLRLPEHYGSPKVKAVVEKLKKLVDTVWCGWGTPGVEERELSD